MSTIDLSRDDRRLVHNVVGQIHAYKADTGRELELLHALLPIMEELEQYGYTGTLRKSAKAKRETESAAAWILRTTQELFDKYAPERVMLP